MSRRLACPWNLARVVICLYILAVTVAVSYGTTTAVGTFGPAGCRVGGLVAGGPGASALTYWYKHDASCPWHGASTTGWVPVGQLGGLIAGVNSESKTTQFALHHGATDISDWKFTAANVRAPPPPAGVLLTDSGADIGLGAFAIRSIADAAEPPFPESLAGNGTASCKTALEIGGLMFGPIVADDPAPLWRRLLGPAGFRTTLQPRNAAGALSDDMATRWCEWTVTAPGYDPIVIAQEQITLSADGGGSEAYCHDDGLLLYGPYARVEMSWSVIAHGSFNGTATLSNGAFGATGDLAALPWQLTGSGNTTSVFLASADFPGGYQEVLARDVGDQAFWASGPSLDGKEGVGCAEAVPEPATLALLVLGGLAAQRRRRAGH